MVKMRQVTQTNRTKKVYNITVEELKKGKWLDELPDADYVELTYKNNYLVINSAVIRKIKKSEMEEDKNGRTND